MTRKRIDRIHLNHSRSHPPDHNHRTTRSRPTPATFPAPVRIPEMTRTVFLVGKRPPLAQYPLPWRWLARFVYHRINWCPDYGIEYQAIYDNEAAARHAASMPGGFYMELPLNAELPAETSQFGKHDFPLSEASAEYRNRQFPLVAVPRAALARLEQQLLRTQPIVKEYHKSA